MADSEPERVFGELLSDWEASQYQIANEWGTGSLEENEAIKREAEEWKERFRNAMKTVGEL